MTRLPAAGGPSRVPQPLCPCDVPSGDGPCGSHTQGLAAEEGKGSGHHGLAANQLPWTHGGGTGAKRGACHVLLPSPRSPPGSAPARDGDVNTRASRTLEF